MASEPNYSNYTVSELHESLLSIDRGRFPERLKKIKDELTLRSHKAEQVSENKRKKMNPNKKNAMAFCLLFSIMLSTLYAEFIPMKGLVWLTKQTHPQTYWFTVGMFGLLSFYYAKKYINERPEQ